MDLPAFTALTSNGEISNRVLRGLFHIRLFGWLLALICAFGVLWRHTAAHWLLPAVAIIGVLFPIAARWAVARSFEALLLERRIQYAEAAITGLAVAGLGFPLLPGATLCAMLGIMLLFAGGPRQLVVGMAIAAGAMTIGYWLPHATWATETTTTTVLTSLPAIALFPLLVTWKSFQIAHTMGDRLDQWVRRGCTDGLTGLANRAHFEGLVRSEFNRQRRYGGKPASLVALDIDHFKSINDRFGHDVGDYVLKTIATRLLETLRASDCAARLGGDELSILLPNTDARATSTMIHRVRKQIGDIPFKRNGHQFRCTLSVGIATFDESISSPQDWLKCADEGLYAAKRMGRNRIHVFRREFSNLPRYADLQEKSIASTTNLSQM